MTVEQGSTIEGDIRKGPIRRSVNAAINVKGSIHDDATATRLGLRGGTVAGSVHMDLFGPLLLETFGERWWETGDLSLYFLNATTDREPVQASTRLPASGTDDVQVECWVDREDGMRVAEGSAAVGHPSEPSALRRRPIRDEAPENLRILKHLNPGMPLDPSIAKYQPQTFAEHMTRITEPMTMHESSRWGGPVVPLAGYVNLFHGQALKELRNTISAVGLFGAVEIRNINGPLLVDTEYRMGGRVLSLGESPKTEYFWYEAWADDPAGKRVAEQLMLLRFMKASSPLYSES